MQNYVFYEAFLPTTRLLMHAIWTRRRFTSIERMNAMHRTQSRNLITRVLTVYHVNLSVLQLDPA